MHFIDFYIVNIAEYCRKKLEIYCFIGPKTLKYSLLSRETSFCLDNSSKNLTNNILTLIIFLIGFLDQDLGYCNDDYQFYAIFYALHYNFLTHHFLKEYSVGRLLYNKKKRIKLK